MKILKTIFKLQVDITIDELEYLRLNSGDPLVMKLYVRLCQVFNLEEKGGLKK